MSRKLPSTKVCDRYGIDRRTLGRWQVDPDMGFPSPQIINGRNYFEEDELDSFDKSCARRVAQKSHPQAA
jgi:hypothetical protein